MATWPLHRLGLTFDNPRMEELFGKSGLPPHHNDEPFHLPNLNDPAHGVARRTTVTEAQRCLIDFLLEPARLQYRALTQENTGSKVSHGKSGEDNEPFHLPHLPHLNDP